MLDTGLTDIVRGKDNLIDAISLFDSDFAGEYVRIMSSDPYPLVTAMSFMEKDPGAAYALRSAADCEDMATVERIINFPGMFNSFLNIFLDGSGEGGTIKDAYTQITVPLDLAKKEDSDLEEMFKEIEEKIEASDDRKERFGLYKSKRQIENAIEIKKYAQSRSVDISDARMNLILHKQYDGRRVLVSEHPNIPDLYHFEEKSGGKWYSSDLTRKMMLDSGHFKRRFAECIEYLRENNMLDPDLVYMGEGIKTDKETDKLVQLRPCFRKVHMENGNPKILCQFDPDEGVVLEFDEYDLDYEPTFILAAGVSGTHYAVEEVEECLLLSPGCVAFQKPSTGIDAERNYLSHAGLRVLELTKVLDMTGNLVSYSGDLYKFLQLENPPSKVRYNLDKKGEPMLEILEK